MANDNYRHYKFFEAANEILKHKAEEGVPSNAYLNGLAKRYGITTQEALAASKWLESKKSGNDAFPDDSAIFPSPTDEIDPFVLKLIAEFDAPISSPCDSEICKVTGINTRE
jgi:hypothetical protein